MNTKQYPYVEYPRDRVELLKFPEECPICKARKNRRCQKRE